MFAIGKGVLYLVPEIALTSQVIGQIIARFGKAVAVLHSHLADTERFDQWQRIRLGEAPIIIGARSAIFAPIPNLGLIVVDEEHEPSYKQEVQPRYHTRQVALQRARGAKAVVVLGSATPSLESYCQAQENEFAMLQLPERVEQRPMPKVEVVDLRDEFKQGRPSALSAPLCEAIKEALANKQQTILFLNRRAYASFLLCRLCGQVPECPYCSVSLAYHQTGNDLRCHHCEYVCRVPKICPKCNGNEMKPFGVGTQRVEEETRLLFPDAKIVRLDKDVLSKKTAYLDVLHAFRTGEADILVGTQMVAKGLDFPRVAVVGVINADTAMHLPDFRAGERTFQLLTQVAGRAGRGNVPGKVIAQTFNPEHPAIQFGQNHDFVGFYEQEITHRRQLNYPPFSQLVNFIISHKEDARAEEVAADLANELRSEVTKIGTNAEALGPAACPISKIKTLYRRHVLLKAPLNADAAQIARNVIARIDTKGCQLTIDVQPQSLM
ncbi:MAG: primosomal protein N' [bacterium]